jgi:exosortase/archaeosortase family protein
MMRRRPAQTGTSAAGSPPPAARRALVTRFGLLIIVSAASLDLYLQGRDTIRSWESRAVAALLEWIGINQVQGAFRSYVLISPRPGTLIAGNVTTSCSTALPLLFIAVATLGLIPGRPLYRFQRCLLASAIVIAVNIIRLLVVIGAGATMGPAVMAPVHEWAGSLISLVGWALAILALFSLGSQQRNGHRTSTHVNVHVDPVGTGAPVG